MIRTLLYMALGFLMSCQKTVSQGRTFAVVVGVSDYQALSYANGDLRFADQDAQQVVDFLQSKEGGNVPISQIRFLRNHNATQASIRQALTLFQQAEPGDRVIFYFSGHGMPDSFVPYDNLPGDAHKLVTHADIKAAFHASKASTKLCIADACLSGRMTRRQTTPASVLKTLAQTISNEKNVAMILASRSTQGAVESRQLAGGAFTYFMLKGLKGSADQDGNQIVTIRELHQYVAPRVKKITRGHQTPVFYGRFSDDLPLAYL
ncbi:caspase family protein [Spirosoma sp. BT702]|uniref:Caspase family protein n=1 Tax=Spirosoma profusum TaxID=2771354 RepID=A0A927AT52_9BACT|nr:caspase family protein [Spirosoma profusum]MBD2699297.1 caspase family protein [Spirosoma profusum]